jgi:hypothetical protein
MPVDSGVGRQCQGKEVLFIELGIDLTRACRSETRRASQFDLSDAPLGCER